MLYCIAISYVFIINIFQIVVVKNPFLNISTCCIVIIFIAITMRFKGNPAEKNPAEFVEFLNMRKTIHILFYVISGVYFVGLLLLIWLYGGSANSDVFSTIVCILNFFMCYYIGIALLGILSSSSADFGFLSLTPKRDNRYLRFCAQLCFKTAAEAISKPYNKKEIAYFKNGINYLNAFLKIKYNVQLLKVQEYVNYFKTAALADTRETKRIKDATVKLANKLSEDIDLNELLAATRNICGKSPAYTIKEKTSELDYEVGIWKRLSQNNATVTSIIISIVLTIVTIAWPYIVNHSEPTSALVMPFFLLLVVCFGC
jgi:hypothetical protein